MSFFDKLKKSLFSSDDLVKEIEIDDVELEYILKKEDSNCLFVVFISDDENEYYDYYTVFRPLKVNQLYIQSDIFDDGRSYLYEKGFENVEKSVFKLINAVVNECQANRLYFFGYGIDGAHALNYAIPYEGATAILGSPIYNLGSYLESEFMEEQYDDLLYYDKYKLDKLDRSLMIKMLDPNYLRLQRVFLQSSVNQKIYTDHVRDLVRFLEKNHFDLKFKKAFYEEDEKSFVNYCEYLMDTIPDLIRWDNKKCES